MIFIKVVKLKIGWKLKILVKQFVVITIVWIDSFNSLYLMYLCVYVCIYILYIHIHTHSIYYICIHSIYIIYVLPDTSPLYFNNRDKSQFSSVLCLHPSDQSRCVISKYAMIKNQDQTRQLEPNLNPSPTFVRVKGDQCLQEFIHWRRYSSSVHV